MDLLHVFTAFAAFALVCSATEELDISKIKFSEEASKQILRTQWLPFGTSDRPADKNVYTNSDSPVVTTHMGTVRGVLKESSRRKVTYATFFGMPYAKPPIGNLRFAGPVPAEPWEGEYDGTFERPSCLQFEGTPNSESEDCLYINVYTTNYKNDTDPLPVMVFIYGGAFIAGSSNSSIYSPDFIIEKDVVLVTFNYRLGVLGFLSLQNEAIPGNAGLKDQTQALKWVRDNIACFGGDPNRVTIFGESAGSASVNYHVISPLSKGLFHGAIMESGVTGAPWAFTPPTEVLRLANSLARKVSCHHECMDEMLSCLRKVPASLLTEVQQGALSIQDVMRLRPFAFVPTQEPEVNGAFLSQQPEKVIAEGRHNHVPLMIGSNTREGLIVLPVLKNVDPLGFGVSLIGFDLSLFYPHQLREKKSFMERRAIHSKIKKFYFGSAPVSLFTRGKLIDLISDCSFTVPIQMAAALLANASTPVYNYVFSYSGDYNFYKYKLGLSKEKGVCHGDELGYLFYCAGLHPPYSRAANETHDLEAENVLDVMTTMWTNFAKTGNPTEPLNELVNVEWKPRTLNDLIYLDIGPGLTLRNGADNNLQKTIDFWYNLVKNDLIK